MITFSSRNIDGRLVSWEFDSAYAIEDEFYGNADLPANDDEIYEINIDSTAIFIEDIIGQQPVFLDLIHLLGVEAPE